MNLIKAGYNLINNVYTKNIGPYKITIMPLNTGYLRKINRGPQFVSSKVFLSLDEIESDKDLFDLTVYVDSLTANTVESKKETKIELKVKSISGNEVITKPLNDLIEQPISNIVIDEVATKPLLNMIEIRR